MTRARTRLTIESLEDRTLMSTCHVTRLSDSGVGKGFRGDLRYCINKVTAEPGPDVIDFTVTGTINLNNPLPDIRTDTDIQGPGASLLTVRRAGTPDQGPLFRIFTIWPVATASLSGLTIANGNLSHPTLERGGGVHNEGALTIEDCIITGNRTGYDNGRGGGVYNAGVMTIRRTLINQNKAEGFYTSIGGGVYNIGDLTVIDSTIGANKAIAGDDTTGGGLANYGTASIYSSTISYNEAALTFEKSVGGGVFNSSVVVVLNTTIVGNRAERGAGVYTDSPAELTVVSHSTISNNTLGSSGGDGIFCKTASPLFMRNTIVAGHPDGDIYCQLTSSNYNLIGNSSAGGGYSSTDLLDVDPMLGPLINNGGPTYTRALLPGSPAIDAGDNTDAPEWDQRGPGFPRIVNGMIDIGAFEVQATAALDIGGRRTSPDLAALMAITTDNPIQNAAVLPRSGFITQPRVAQRTLGEPAADTPILKGLDRLPAMQPLRGMSMTGTTNPGCAARPWAMECNPFGVEEELASAVEMGGTL